MEKIEVKRIGKKEYEALKKRSLLRTVQGNGEKSLKERLNEKKEGMKENKSRRE